MDGITRSQCWELACCTHALIGSLLVSFLSYSLRETGNLESGFKAVKWAGVYVISILMSFSI